MKTNEELKAIAVDLADGKIFSDRHLQANGNGHMMGQVFMPIILGAFSEKTEEEMKDVCFIYEYYSAAGPTSINGCPIFFSFRFLNEVETNAMFEFYEKYVNLKKEFNEFA